MKKNFGISIGTIITVMLLVVTVYANTHVDTNDKISESEMNMITLATDEKNMLKYFASTEDTLVQTVNLSSENNVKYNYDKAIKCYSIFDIDKDKILDEIDEYNVVIPIEKNNDTVGIANLKKGDDVSKVRKDLSNKDISQAEKERILENAFKHEGKYYISSVIRLNNVSKEANIFFGINEDTDVKKFFFVSKYNLYIAVIEENDEEYIIPYSLSHMLILENGQRYKLSQAVELLSNSNN